MKMDWMVLKFKFYISMFCMLVSLFSFNLSSEVNEKEQRAQLQKKWDEAIEQLKLIKKMEESKTVLQPIREWVDNYIENREGFPNLQLRLQARDLQYYLSVIPLKKEDCRQSYLDFVTYYGFKEKIVTKKMLDLNFYFEKYCDKGFSDKK